MSDVGHGSTLAVQQLDDILEKDWQRTVVDLAKQLGWKRLYHTHDSRRSAHGFPDLVIVRDRVIFLELKRQKGRLTDEQAGWLRDLRAAGAEAYVARPADLEHLATVLSRRLAYMVAGQDALYLTPLGEQLDQELSAT